MFEKFRKKTPESMIKELEKEITQIGDIGTRNAIRHIPEPVEVAINRLDMIRLKGEESGMEFVATLASRQIDRILEARG